jgi:hypothetical protein
MKEVAERFAVLCQQRKFIELLELVDPDVVRVGRIGGELVEIHGIDGMREHVKRLTDSFRVESIKVDGPYLLDSRFALHVTTQWISLHTGTQKTATRVEVHTVRDDMIVRIEIYDALSQE